MHSLTATRAVLSASEDERPESSDEPVDVECLCERLRTENHRGFTANTLRTYEQRFREAVARYARYVERDITYPFPIRTGRLAELTVPRNMNEKESARLAAFVRTLGLSEPTESPQRASEQSADPNDHDRP